jgi:MarR family transcriptional regulator, organic hydroperoxide resistance regulator
VGRDVQREVVAERDRAEATLLASFTPQEQRLLRDLLTRLAADRPDTAGSCL